MLRLKEVSQLIILPNLVPTLLNFCRWEANVQLERDRDVETEIVSILRRRAEDCKYYEGDVNAFYGHQGQPNKCRDLFVSF